MRKAISREGLSAVLVLILALVCLPVAGLGVTEQSFTGKVVGVECTATGIIVSISVTAREGITEQEASAQRRPSIEEVRLDISCQAKESSIWKFVRKKTRQKEVTVRFSGVDRSNHPMADVLLPGDQSLRALIETRFSPHPRKN